MSQYPKPGEEGFVHPDGTPEAAQQLEQNRAAAADRAATDNVDADVLHGAPAAIQEPEALAAVTEQIKENAAAARAKASAGNREQPPKEAKSTDSANKEQR